MNRFTEDDILSNLNKYFNYKTLRPGQLPIIQNILDKKDVLICKKSDFGKSLCFQLSGLMRDGIVVIVSPLISRIEEKCYELSEFKIKYNILNSNTKHRNGYDNQDLRSVLTKKNKVLDDLQNITSSGLKFLYVTLEHFVNSSRLQQTLKEIYKKNLLQAVVIDGVHCVEQWHSQFKKDYSVLGKFRYLCPNTPFLCFVKPINKSSFWMIQDTLDLKQPYTIYEPSFNENVSFKVMYTKENFSHSKLVDFLTTMFPKKVGLIYCQNKDDCEALSETLSKHNIKNIFYHSHLSEDDKNWLCWMNSEGIVVTCVSGSNVDVDLPNVSYVIHTCLPSSLEVYLQESVKVNRNEDVKCILFHNTTNDEMTLRRISEHIYRERKKPGSNSSTYDIKRQLKEQTRNAFDVVMYAENDWICRQHFLLSHLWDDRSVATLPCGVCDVCEIMQNAFVVDVSHSLKKILLAVWAINIHQRNGSADQFCDVNIENLVELLRGRMKQELAGSWLTKQWFFASFSAWNRKVLQKLVFVLLSNRFVALNHVFDDKCKLIARNLVITTDGRFFVKSSNELNISFSKHDVALIMWLNLEKVEFQFRQDLESIVLYHTLHNENQASNNADYVWDLLQNIPETWEKFKKIRRKYTQKEKCEFDEDLFTNLFPQTMGQSTIQGYGPKTRQNYIIDCLDGFNDDNSYEHLMSTRFKTMKKSTTLVSAIGIKVLSSVVPLHTTLGECAIATSTPIIKHERHHYDFKGSSVRATLSSPSPNLLDEDDSVIPSTSGFSCKNSVSDHLISCEKECDNVARVQRRSSDLLLETDDHVKYKRFKYESLLNLYGFKNDTLNVEERKVTCQVEKNA